MISHVNVLLTLYLDLYDPPGIVSGVLTALFIYLFDCLTDVSLALSVRSYQGILPDSSAFVLQIT